MEMDPDDFKRLKKLMMMTTSSMDGESAAAMRKANDLLKKYKMTWEELLDCSVTVKHVSDIEEAPREMSEEEMINEAFRIIDDGPTLTGSFAQFIESLRGQWEEKGWLSLNQRAALFKSAERARR